MRKKPAPTTARTASAAAPGEADPLASYGAKRDFSVTPEPPPKTSPRATTAEPASRGHFVVQRHDARRLHYDVRLEIAGAMASWAVPKGPSYDPTVKRLAVETEDHPMEYAGFEGSIPAGEYGGGDVVVWDRGSYETVPPRQAEAMRAKGHLHVRLFGEKLHGEWHLVRTAGRAAKGERGKAQPTQWLLFKAADRFADPTRDVVAERPESVLSAPATGTKALLAAIGDVMRATNPPAGARLPSGQRYWFELKYDGYRLLAAKSGAEVRLWSRNGKDWTERFRLVADAIARLPASELVLDGEACAVDDDDAPSFQRLQQWVAGERADARLVYAAFDLLRIDGEDVRGEPIESRRARLGALLEGAPEPITLSSAIDGDAKPLLDACRARGLEGLVAKRKGSPYVAGASADWVKLKCERRGDFAVIGYLPMAGMKSVAGALLLGVVRERVLRFAGRVGVALSDGQRRSLARSLDERRIDAAPVDDAERLPQAHWSTPTLCAEVAYVEATDDGRLRHPKLIRIRDDKTAMECVEEPAGRGADAGRADRDARDEDGPPLAAPAPAPIRAWPKPTLSNRDKVLFPRDGIRKRELWDYAATIAPTMLPHLAGRPLNLQRWPNGIDRAAWYQHRPPERSPEYVRLIDTGGDAPHVAAENVETLQWLVNLASITLHQWASHAPTLAAPDYSLIDLDPGDGTWADLVEVARAVRVLLEALELPSVVKTSGKRGVHVFVPLARAPRPPTHDEATRFAEQIAGAVAKVLPEIATVERLKAKRGGRLYVDAGQNGEGRTVVSPYTVRAVDGATVSTPIRWDELDERLDPRAFTIRTVPERVAKVGDLFAFRGEGADVRKVLGG